MLQDEVTKKKRNSSIAWNERREMSVSSEICNVYTSSMSVCNLRVSTLINISSIFHTIRWSLIAFSIRFKAHESKRFCRLLLATFFSPFFVISRDLCLVDLSPMIYHARVIPYDVDFQGCMRAGTLASRSSCLLFSFLSALQKLPASINRIVTKAEQEANREVLRMRKLQLRVLLKICSLLSSVSFVIFMNFFMQEEIYRTYWNLYIWGGNFIRISDNCQCFEIYCCKKFDFSRCLCKLWEPLIFSISATSANRFYSSKFRTLHMANLQFERKIVWNEMNVERVFVYGWSNVFPGSLWPSLKVFISILLSRRMLDACREFQIFFL